MGKNTKMLWDVIVIGAGASGMMAAITAARRNKKVIIIEKLDKAGKKLLATGNGKCNFTNSYMNPDCYRGDLNFVEHVLDCYSVEDCLNFFRSIGICPKDKNGYYYPNSEQAGSVVNALLDELDRRNVAISYETNITNIIPEKTGVRLLSNKGEFVGKKLIIATGLLASPKLGSDGSLFNQIKELGHRFSPILPALCGYYCKGIDFKRIAGVRAHGTVTAIVDGKNMAQDSGEIQFTEYGLSGIPVFQISHYLSKGLYEKKDVRIFINLLPDFDEEKLIYELNFRKNLYAHESIFKMLNGLINIKLSEMIFNKLNFDKNRTVSSLTETDIQNLVKLLQKLKVSVINYRDFEFAQVCTGGIPVSDIDTNTLESKHIKNVYFTGELIDVDGICGGYNLHFAWATGYIAGQEM